MIDISQTMRDAANSDAQWSPAEVRECATTLAVLNECDIDWDEGSGEDWVSLIRHGHRILLLSVLHPLAFVSGEVETAADRLSVVHVSAFDERVLQCEDAALLGFFGEGAWRELIDLGGFCVRDLWFATV